MAMDAGEVKEKIEGTEFTEPVFGLKAIWIDPESRDLAMSLSTCRVPLPTSTPLIRIE